MAQESSTDSVDHISPSRIDPVHLASHVDNCPRPQTVARESTASRTSSPSQSFETTDDVQPDFFFIVIIIIIDRFGSDQTRPTDRSDDDKQAIETTGYTHRQAASAGTTNGFPAGDGTGGCRSVDWMDWMDGDMVVGAHLPSRISLISVPASVEPMLSHRPGCLVGVAVSLIGQREWTGQRAKQGGGRDGRVGYSGPEHVCCSPQACVSGWLSWDPSLAVSSDSAPFIHSVLIVVHILRKKERKKKYISYTVYITSP